MDAEIVDDGIYGTATGLSCCAQEGDMSATRVTGHKDTWGIYADIRILLHHIYSLCMYIGPWSYLHGVAVC
jgi:hypothetical protein